MACIRNSAKAVIIEDDKLLLTKNRDKYGVFYLLPGGGQQKFESIPEALKRECREELNREVIVGDILYVRDYIGKNHQFAEEDRDFHQIEYMFDCELKSDKESAREFVKIDSPDDIQIGVEWVPLNKLVEYRLYPGLLKKRLTEDWESRDRIYLGDVN